MPRLVHAVLLLCVLEAGAWAQEAAEDEAAVEAAPYGFTFGSYGRVGVGSDLRGSTPEPATVVAHGPRVVEKTYVELDLYYAMEARGTPVRVVTTLAFGDPLFHYTGELDAGIGVRNLFAEAILRKQVGVWIGSRMVRGDDIFLLDFWPLDEANTVGGGAWWQTERWRLGAFTGANRLLDPFQYQEMEVADPVYGSSTIVELDRQRWIFGLSAEARILGEASRGPGAKAKLYLEGQAMPDGTARRADDTELELPDDYGWTAGAQLGGWGFVPGELASHANLFVRYSQGLTAIDELAAPEALAPDGGVYPQASEFLMGLSSAAEIPFGSVLLGGYLRRFIDADPSTEDRDDGWEYVIDARPQVAVLPELLAAVDLSYQARFPRAVSPVELRALDPAVFQIAPMIVYSPYGPAPYARPQLRVIYRAARRNEGARDLFVLEDPRRDRTWTHFVGLQAEWWFNSTYR